MQRGKAAVPLRDGRLHRVQVPHAEVHEVAGGGRRLDALHGRVAATVAGVAGPGASAAAAVAAVGRVGVVAVGVEADVVGRAVRGRVAQAGLPVADQDRHGYPARRRDAAHQLQALVLPLPLALVAAVLEPDLHLGGGELQHVGQVVPLRGREVFLLLEAALQLVDLRLREKHAGFPPLPLPGPLRLFGVPLLLLQRLREDAELCGEAKTEKPNRRSEGWRREQL